MGSWTNEIPANKVTRDAHEIEEVRFVDISNNKYRISPRELKHALGAEAKL